MFSIITRILYETLFLKKNNTFCNVYRNWIIWNIRISLRTMQILSFKFLYPKSIFEIRYKYIFWVYT